MCVEDEKLICNNGGFTPVYYLVSILCYIQEVSSVERERTWCVPSGVDYVIKFEIWRNLGFKAEAGMFNLN